MYGPFCWRNPSQASGGAYCAREPVNWPRPLVVFLFFFVVFETKQSVFKKVETIHPSQRLGRRAIYSIITLMTK